MLDSRGPGVKVGPSILSLVTSGIYEDPLSIYREYIQNAVDELSRRNRVEGAVQIAIDPRQKKVSILDNGPGLTYQECLEELVPISQSRKCLGRDRGFRGIGRLSGLAFAESVTFLTRTSTNEPVTRLAWSRRALDVQTDSGPGPEQGFPNWVEVETIDGFDYPRHFFRVDIDGISRHSAGALLNREAVREYIGEVCPVPVASDFTFFEEIQGLFAGRELPYSLRVTLDGEGQPILRQYGSAIGFNGNREDRFREFEEVRVPSVDGSSDAAVGWIAHSSYLGAIPKANRIRGIRARIGNIQVGGERSFDHLFEEERFNRWCVGEVHILDSRIVPNGRRDYFERNPHLRNLENHLATVFRNIAARCRSASSNRNQEKKLAATIVDLEAMFELASSGYLSHEGSRAVVVKALAQIAKSREWARSSIDGGADTQKLDHIEARLNTLPADNAEFPVRDLTTREVVAYQKVFGAIAATTLSPRTMMNIIEGTFHQERPVSNGHGTTGP